MASTKTAEAPARSAAAPVKSKTPTPEAHLAVAAKHAAAEKHHMPRPTR